MPRSILSGADGWLVISNTNEKRSATRAYKEATRPFTNHPGRCAATPPLKGGEWGRNRTRLPPVKPLHDFDAQQGRKAERLCRIDNGAGDILSSEPQTVDSGTSQIRAAQFRLTHLHISEIATPENTAPKICTIK